MIDLCDSVLIYMNQHLMCPYLQVCNKSRIPCFDNVFGSKKKWIKLIIQKKMCLKTILAIVG